MWDISSNFKSQKTAHRAAKRPPAGNQNLSKVTSGYVGLMIQLGRIHTTPKNGGYMGEAQKNEYFRAKNHYHLWYSVMTVTKSWMSSRKN